MKLEIPFDIPFLNILHQCCLSTWNRVYYYFKVESSGITSFLLTKINEILFTNPQNPSKNSIFSQHFRTTHRRENKRLWRCEPHCWLIKDFWVDSIHQISIHEAPPGGDATFCFFFFKGEKSAHGAARMDFGEVATPWKINMEHNHGGLEDHFPF